MHTSKLSLRNLAGIVIVHLCFLTGAASAAVLVKLSPSVMSNTYSGFITLQISNLTAGATVTVQKFQDVNSNGVVDANDFLVQQFQVADGQGPTKFSGATNVNIPYDLNPGSGAITVQLSPAAEGYEQRTIGQYLFVVSSPTSAFTPVTNVFDVTNSSYGQKFTGKIMGGGVNLANAIVILSRPPGSSDSGFNPLAAATADSSGTYTIKAPPDTYRLIAFKQGYVANLNTAPIVTLGGGATITTNLFITNATRTISGRVVDSANSNLGLPAILMAAQANSKNFGLGVTDTNGYFSLPAMAEQYGFGFETAALDFHDYIDYNNSPALADATTGSVVNVSIAFPKATAIIYGSVKDGNNNPVSGVSLYGDNGTNGDGTYQGDATTDGNGNYAMGVNAGLWSPGVDNGNNSFSFPNYDFSQGPQWSDNNGGSGTNVTDGAAILANFGALLATNQIMGYVKDNNGNPIVGVQVDAYATIDGQPYQAQQNTDSNGNYSLNVGTADWNVSVYCCCDNSSLQSIGNYQCPNSQDANVSNATLTRNFIVQTNNGGGGGTYTLDGYVQDNLGNPIVGVTVSANNGQGNNLSTSTDGSGYYQFSVANGTWNVSVDCGGLTSMGYSCPGGQQATVSNGNYDNVDFTVTSCSTGLAVTTTFLPDGMVGETYSNLLENTGCNGPFTWSLTPGSLPLPAGIGISNNGVIFGTPTVAAAYGGVTNYFSVRVTDSGMNTADQLLSIIIYPTLTIGSGAFPNGTNGISYSGQVLVSGGDQYYIGSNPDGYSAMYNGSVPPGLNFSYGATTVSNQYFVFSGIPTNTGTFMFTLGATDADGNQVQRSVSITIVASSLGILTTSLNNATVGVNYTNQLSASGGTPPYTWTIALGSQPLPPNLNLSTNGIISGVATSAGTNSFIVRVTDHNAVTTTRVLQLIVVAAPSRPGISSPARLSNGHFQMTVNGTAGQNYTIQYAPSLGNPSNWSTLEITNPAASAFSVTDPNATNSTRFYRVLVGP